MKAPHWSPLREITCHIVSQCYLSPGSGDFPTGTPVEAGIWFFLPWRDTRLSWPRWWLHPKIVYPWKTDTYLRNDQAVLWPGFKPATESCKSNVLTTSPSHLSRTCRLPYISTKWLWRRRRRRKCDDLKCVRKPTKSRLSLTHHGNKSSRWAE